MRRLCLKIPFFFVRSGKPFFGMKTVICWFMKGMGELVSSCDCVIIPNLTRGVRPYALIENVVTRTDCRGKGFASQCLARAGALAAAAGCYKVMLMTGSRQESTLRFYRKAGFDSEEKTAFVLRLDR